MSSCGDLASAFSAGGTVTLGASFDCTGTVVAVGATSVTLDLDGYHLSVDSSSVSSQPGIGVPVGAVLTVEDTSASSDGTLTATGGGAAAGVGGAFNGAGGSVTVSGGSLTATAGSGGAGVGGGYGGAGGSVTVSGGSLTATGGQGGAGVGAGQSTVSGPEAVSGRSVTVSGGSLTATGGMFAAGVGGGELGGGGAVTVSGGSLTATGGSEAAGVGGGELGAGGSVTVGVGGSLTATDGGAGADAVGYGASGASFGSLSNAGALDVPGGATESVPSGVTVDNSGTMTVRGVLTEPGTVHNTGTILTAGSGSIADTLHGGSLTIDTHSYALSFDVNGSPDTAPGGEYVYAATVADSAQTLPAAPTAPSAQTFTGWFTQASGGTKVDDTTNLHDLFGDGPLTETLHAQYTANGGGGGGGGGMQPQSIRFTAPPNGMVGETATLTATGGPSGNPVVFTVDATSGAGVCTVSGDTVSYTAAGTCVVDANQAGNTDYSPAPQVTQAITVTAQAPAVRDPGITATVSDGHHHTDHGWYRHPVTITFSCTPGSAPLSSPCPAPVTLHRSGRNESVTKTITATDGGTATVTVSKINIDTSPPNLHVTGATNAQTYAHVRHLECTAHDAVSGVASCTIQQSRHTHRGVTTISWLATATDIAGNATTRHGHYHLRGHAALRGSQPKYRAVPASADR